MEQFEQKEIPQTLDVESVVKYLHTKSICGCIDAFGLSELLGTISVRMIRIHTRQGRLKAMDNTAGYHIYKVEDVAKWLIQNPRYLFRPQVDNSELSDERIAEIMRFARAYIIKRWRTLLNHEAIEDLVANVMARICRYKRTKNVSDYTLVYRALCKEWAKIKRRPQLIGMDNVALERMAACEDDAESEENDNEY